MTNKLKFVLATAAAALGLVLAGGQAYAALTLGANSATNSGLFTIQGTGNLDLDSAAVLNIGTSTATSLVVGNIAASNSLLLQGGSSGLTASSTGLVTIVSNKNAAGAISLTTSAGTSETILIKSLAGTAATSINVVSSSGGITLNASSAVAITNNATVGGTLGVTATSTLATTTITGLTVSQAATFSSTLGVTGVSSLGNASSTGLTVAGPALFGNASPGNTARLFQVATTTPANNYFLAVMGNGNISASGTLPTLSLGGTNPVLYPGSNNLAGLFMVGGGIVSSSTLTFVPPFTRTPSCVASIASTTVGVAISASATPTTVLFVGPSNITNAVISYHCIGVGE